MATALQSGSFDRPVPQCSAAGWLSKQDRSCQGPRASSYFGDDKVGWFTQTAPLDVEGACHYGAKERADLRTGDEVAAPSSVTPARIEPMRWVIQRKLNEFAITD